MNFDFETDIELINERAHIRPLTTDYFEQLLPVASAHKDLLQYSPSPIYSEELLRNYINQAIQDKKNHLRYAFVICDKLKMQYAGSTSFLNIVNKDKRLEIGHTWIGKDFQGSGLNEQVKALLLGYAFDKLEFERVEFKTDERNAASRKALEKLGAVYEGRLRSHMLMADGFRRNSVYYSILREEWVGKTKKIA
jgi:RimJ/RimL family protein N-acetyltransferase